MRRTIDARENWKAEQMTPPTFAEISLSAKNDAYENAAKLCEREADACMSDIVPGDEIGQRDAHARAGALLTAAGDIRELIR